MKKVSLVSLVALLISLSGCQLATGIFKAGVGVGVFVVVAIIAVIIFIIAKVASK